MSNVRALRSNLCPHCRVRPVTYRDDGKRYTFRPLSRAAVWLRYPGADGGLAELCEVCQDAVERDERYWGQPWGTRL